MATEIERKFLVHGSPWQEMNIEGARYTQGYLSTDPQRVIRIRLRQKGPDESAYITIKSHLSALSSTEYEYAIPPHEARILLQTLAKQPLIEKIRYQIPHETHLWDVDVFLGANAGLVVAEVELGSEAESFATPTWIGQEVSHDMRYKNVHLINNPYSQW